MLNSVNLNAMNNVLDVDFYLKLSDKSSKWLSELLNKSEIVIGRKINGKVCELGAGTGTLSSLLSRKDLVDKVYAIEYSENFVEKIMPVIFEKRKAEFEKIRKIKSDFNNLEFDSGFFDFIFEVGAFHHSENIEKTVAESYRVLKKGGVFIGFDRSHPDRTSEKVLNKFRNRQISDKQKIRYGFKKEDHITRSDMGEHEYRKKDWYKFFNSCGFKTFIYTTYNRTSRRGKLLNPIVSRLEQYILKYHYSFLSLPCSVSKTIIIAEKN